VFLFSLLLGFHIGFIAQHKQHRMLVMEGKYVASYYIKHNNFLMDFAASVSFAFQVQASQPPSLHNSTCLVARTPTTVKTRTLLR
jgi:hypothetical protein